MQPMIIGIIVILLGTTLYFGYRYFSLKRHAHINQEIVNGMRELAAGNTVDKVDGAGQDHIAFNELVEFTKNMNDMVHSLTNDVNKKGGNLIEHAEYAAEKADIVKAAIDEVEKGLKKQLVATEESTTSIEDITNSIEELSIRSAQISDQSNTTLDLTQEGNDKLKDSMEKMAQFNQTINTTFEAINVLGKKSHEIGMIVKVITGISEQINLLALNAAIEAARAGEHGKGFAVVADEVRKLAGQSSESAFEVSNIVKNIQEETARVVKSMKQGTEEFSETNTTILEIGSMFEKILTTTKTIAENNINSSASAEELASSSQQIMVAMKEIAFISRESVEMFEELIEISSDELQTMDKLVSEAKSLEDLRTNAEKVLVMLKEKETLTK